MNRALIDLSSVIWTTLLAGKDSEYGRQVKSESGKDVWVNSAGYGFENALNHLETVMSDLSLVPRDLIFVVEGKNAKGDRQFIHPAYKAGRDKAAEQYEAFNEIKEEILKTFLALGSQAVSQDGVEADDLIGYLALHLKGTVWIVSADKDLAQCVGGDVHHYRMGQYDRNPFGDFPHDLIPVYIALVGDTGDKIPGVKGFGDGAFQSLYGVFGEEGLRAMLGLIQERKLEALEEDVAELKVLQKIIDDRDGAYLSYELGRLRTEKVNTVRRPLQWQVGMVRPRAQIEEQRLRKHGGTVNLVHQDNYADNLAFFAKNVGYSPEVALDIETSTPPESDAWIESLGKSEERTPVDVFGSELTGMSLTFGRNMQHTIYMTVDHVEEPGVRNLSVAQVVELLEKIPRSKHIVVHNAAFELPVCFNTWGEMWKDDKLYHGFLPNVIDTRIMSSYADENRSAGLKSLSENILGYKQETYQEVTTKEWHEAEWVKSGRPGTLLGHVAAEESGHGGAESFVRVQHKMNELTAKHVLSYGADDTICTAALSNHFRTIMEIEGTWDIFMEVEQFPAYLTAKAFIDGVDFSLETMREMEKEDDVAYDKAWATLREYLISIGFDGVHPPVYTEIDPASIKEACQIVLGQELATKVRTPSKLAKLIVEQFADERADLLASFIENNDLASFNELVASRFDGEPKIDLASPKQMCRLLYDHMKLPVNIVNDATPKEKKDKPELADAIRRFKGQRMGKPITLTDEELVLIRTKAKADDTAIDYALAFDADVIPDDAKAALKAIGVMKKVMTRRSLFYQNYWHVRHWKDGKIHAQINQCAAVTRRYSSSNPNLQQLPKKGEGVKFRTCFLPHHRDAVIASIDFDGQELRLAAERSQDKNMLACYLGDKPKKIHNITSATAITLKWSKNEIAEIFEQYGKDLNNDTEGLQELFIRIHKLPKENPLQKKADDIYKDSKNVNFAAQFGGQALKLSETLVMKVTDAQLFLDARSAMFPDVEKAAQRAEKHCLKTGYAVTMMGARRHLREPISSDDKLVASRAARQAWNMEIQGSAAEMSKLAMARLWKSEFLWKYDTRFIAPIHDELVVSVHRDHVVPALKVMHSCMTAPYCNMSLPNDPKSIPILGSISVGPNFGEQHECGLQPDPEPLQKALSDIFVQREAA